MPKPSTTSRFKTKLLSPAKQAKDKPWSFLILPKTASDILPRRGRTTVAGTLNGSPFQATLEPDGKLSHWMKIDEQLRTSAKIEAGDTVTVEISPVKPEPEPQIPSDFLNALNTTPEAKTTWDDTTTIARVDWIHWIESAKQQKTREKRIATACDMLTKGKRRVCCFDQSGFYSKSLYSPEPSDE